MFDNNCSLHTTAGVYNLLNRGARMTVAQISDATGYMEGPAHGPQNIADMFSRLGISDGSYIWFDSLDQAEAFMRMRPVGTPFGFGYAPTDGRMGHILIGIRSLVGVLYQDPQIHERLGPYVPSMIGRDAIPDANCRYIVFRPGHVHPS